MKTQKIETYEPITIDGLGVINMKDHAFTLTHENGITDFSYEDYLGELYITREEMIEEDVKAESYSHYEALVTDKVAEALCWIKEGQKGYLQARVDDLDGLDEQLKESNLEVENKVREWGFNNQKLVDESEKTFDREKAIKEAEKSIQPADIIELNRRTAYDLLETDPEEVIDFCQSRMLKCA
jgi:hypothetical protein